MFRQRPLLTERDQEVLLSLLKYGHLTTSQLARLHFPSRQIAVRRLRRLSEHGYVATLQPAWAREHVHRLSEAGTRTVAACLGVPAVELEWTVPDNLVTEPALRILLAIAEFRLALTKASEDSSTNILLGFIPGHVEQPACGSERRRMVRDLVADIYDPTTTIEHAPDAVFALETEGRVRLFFLEIDRRLSVASDARHSLRRLLDFYDAYRVRGIHRRYETDFHLTSTLEDFRILLVVHTPQRLQALQAAARERPPGRPSEGLVWLGVRRHLSAANILVTPWAPLRPGRETPFLGSATWAANRHRAAETDGTLAECGAPASRPGRV